MATDRLGKVYRTAPAEIREISPDTAREILTMATAAVRRVTRSTRDVGPADRDDITGAAVMHCLAMVASGWALTDAVAMASVRARDEWCGDRASTRTDADDSALDTLPMPHDVRPDACTVTTVRDIVADALALADADRPGIRAALQAWHTTAQRTPRTPLRDTLHDAVTAHVTPAVVDVMALRAWQTGRARVSRWTPDSAALATVAVERLTGDKGTRQVGNRITPTSGHASDVVVTDRAGRIHVERLERQACPHPGCRVERERVGSAVFCEQGWTGGRVTVLVRRPMWIGPMDGPDVDDVRALWFVRRERARILRDVHARSAHAPTGTDRGDDDFAFATTPLGPVRKSSNRKSKRGGAIGSPTTMRGPRHAWGDTSVTAARMP